MNKQDIPITFGKHKGKMLSQCPASYIYWLSQQDTICGKKDIPQIAKQWAEIRPAARWEMDHFSNDEREEIEQERKFQEQEDNRSRLVVSPLFLQFLSVGTSFTVRVNGQKYYGENVVSLSEEESAKHSGAVAVIHCTNGYDEPVQDIFLKEETAAKVQAWLDEMIKDPPAW